MKRAELRGIRITENELVPANEYSPEDEDRFSIWIEILVGISGEEGSDSFRIMVCSSKWLKERLREDRIAWGIYTIIVDRYDFLVISDFISKTVGKITGENWTEISGKLRNYAYWEFEDYG